LDSVKHLAIRSEGKLKTKLINNTFEIRVDNDFFKATNFEVGHLTGDRLCLALLMVFTPTFSAIATDEVQRDYFKINDFPEFNNVYLEVDFEVSERLKRLFKKKWMFPKLSIETPSLNPKLNNPIYTTPHTSVPWGGGFDSTAGILIFDDLPTCEYYILDYSENRKAKDFYNLSGYYVPTVITNCKHVYSDGGWPIWTAPMLPALLRGDSACFPGTTSGGFLQEGYLYRYNRNLWLDASDICGMIQSTAHSISEYSAAELIHIAGLSRFVCGPNCSEWGISYKSLRKALYMASLDDSFYPDVEFLESKGLVIDFDSPFSERSKFSMDIAEAAIRLKNKPIQSKSLNLISEKVSRFQQPWTLKAPLSRNLSFVGDIPPYLFEHLEREFGKLDIPIMSESEIEDFKNYDYRALV